MIRILFNTIKAGFELENPAFFKAWLTEVIRLENNDLKTEINYIFCDDQYLLIINKNFLGHDYYTDVITFPLIKESTGYLRGEIYISVERVNENALNIGTIFYNELARIMVHGLLHLFGYNDESKSQKLEMREKEDYYLNLLPQNLT